MTDAFTNVAADNLQRVIQEVWFSMTGAPREQVIELLNASSHVSLGEFAECAERLARVDAIPTHLADIIEVALADLGVNLG